LPLQFRERPQHLDLIAADLCVGSLDPTRVMANHAAHEEYSGTEDVRRHAAAAAVLERYYADDTSV